jgi:hypothetical protein
MNIIRRTCAAPNFRTGRQGFGVEAIVIHIVDGAIAGCDATFASSSLALRRSAHYCVAKNGTIHQYVDEQDTAFHAGRIQQPTWGGLKRTPDGGHVNPNLYTIGIEHEGRATDEWMEVQYAASAELLADISRRYPALARLSRDNVIMHREIFAGKTCPGFKVDLQRLIEQATAIATSAPAIGPPTTGGGTATAPQPGLAPIRIVTAVRVRKGAPATTVPFVRILPPSDVPITPAAIVEEGQNVSGISRWYRIADDEFIWAGATATV